MRLLSTICIGLFICSCLGCGKRRVSIYRQTQRAIDTLASREIYALRPGLDSVCQIKMDSMISVKRDSILVAHRKEILKLIGK
jgi:hypothetical protein